MLQRRQPELHTTVKRSRHPSTWPGSAHGYPGALVRRRRHTIRSPCTHPTPHVARLETMPCLSRADDHGSRRVFAHGQPPRAWASSSFHATLYVLVLLLWTPSWHHHTLLCGVGSLITNAGLSYCRLISATRGAHLSELSRRGQSRTREGAVPCVPRVPLGGRPYYDSDVLHAAAVAAGIRPARTPLAKCTAKSAVQRQVACSTSPESQPCHMFGWLHKVGAPPTPDLSLGPTDALLHGCCVLIVWPLWPFTAAGMSPMRRAMAAENGWRLHCGLGWCRDHRASPLPVTPACAADNSIINPVGLGRTEPVSVMWMVRCMALIACFWYGYGVPSTMHTAVNTPANRGSLPRIRRKWLFIAVQSPSWRCQARMAHLG